MDGVKFAAGIGKQTPVLTMAVRGVDVPVSVDERGNFCATFGAQNLRAANLEALHAAAMAASRQQAVKVAVPAMYRAGDNFFDAVLTGIHASHGSLLFRYTDHGGRTKSDNLTDRYGGNRNRIYRRLTEPEIAKLKELEEAQREAEDALEVYRKTVTIDGWEAVRQAVKKAADKLAEEEGGA